MWEKRAKTLASHYLSWQKNMHRTHGNLDEEHLLANIAQLATWVIESEIEQD
jgi:hypothetical protein